MKKLLYMILVFAFITSIPLTASAVAEVSSGVTNEGKVLTDDKIKEIESLVKKNMKDGKVPGLSMVIVQNNGMIYKKGFGYADLNAGKAVDEKTLFELGSNSKAFTGLAILKLQQEGIINLDNPVKEYIPWFEMKYQGEHNGKKVNEYVDITLYQLLHHTSGIPFKTIGDIFPSNNEDALEKTVETLLHHKLDFYPGTKFQYATINYDVLGLVIQKATGVSYEEYVKVNILEPLGLKNTYLLRDENVRSKIAKGYKISFFKPREYDAPIYRGNTPAGYIITNAGDLSEWIKIQLRMKKSDASYEKLIALSHAPDRTVKPSAEGTSYAVGWNAVQDGNGELFHAGENPNFSSYIVIRPEDKIGVGVLANINSEYAYAIGQGIIDIMNGKKVKTNVVDTIKYFDSVFFLVAIVSVPIILVSIFLTIACFIQVLKKQRKLRCRARNFITGFSCLLLFLAGFGYCLYKIPSIMFDDLPWNFIDVWAPFSVKVAVILVFVAVVAFLVLYLTTTIFPKKNDRSLYIVSILSGASGLGNALLIFVINETFARKTDKLQFGLMLFFILGIVVYVYGQRLVRTKLLEVTNNIVYEKRIMMINAIQAASYEKIQGLEDGKIHAGLNNDTETMSVFANLIVTAFTSIVTLICCLIYLGLINFYGFLLSFIIIIVAAGLYFLVGRYANKIYEKTRDIQNVFFKFINDLTDGFKELKINRQKQIEFNSDMTEKCKEYRDQKVKAALAFANVFVTGELLFVFVIGIVVFAFPLLFKEMGTNQLRNYVFIFLYMTGPVNSVLNTIPELIRTNISHKRINNLIEELHGDGESNYVQDTDCDSFIHLRLENVTYTYKNDNNGNAFSIGPINCDFKSGEITFVTGGNGSGKSTLGHILTGLYQPENGSIYLNGKVIGPEQLSQKYSGVFSDFYLFQKLYGIKVEEKILEIDRYLKLLGINEKVEIKEGIFNTTKLSSGQRKRLGLLLAYLEDREIYFFDEWAADQEPAFREFFYNHLLSDLRAKGKCVIVITHDDRYFDTADKLVEMELGQTKSISVLT